MRYLMAAMLAGSMALLASHASAADEADDKTTIAVFTKNSKIGRASCRERV